MYTGVVRLGGSDVEVGGDHVDLVAVTLEVTHRGAPDQLVPAEVMGRIHVSDGEDPHRERE
jgi:hypothetical protein